MAGGSGGLQTRGTLSDTRTRAMQAVGTRPGAAQLPPGQHRSGWHRLPARQPHVLLRHPRGGGQRLRNGQWSAPGHGSGAGQWGSLALWPLCQLFRTSRAPCPSSRMVQVQARLPTAQHGPSLLAPPPQGPVRGSPTPAKPQNLSARGTNTGACPRGSVTQGVGENTQRTHITSADLVGDGDVQSRVTTWGQMSCVRVLSPEASRSRVPVVGPQGPELQDERPEAAPQREPGPGRRALPPEPGPAAVHVLALFKLRRTSWAAWASRGAARLCAPHPRPPALSPAGKPAVVGSVPWPLA